MRVQVKHFHNSKSRHGPNVYNKWTVFFKCYTVMDVFLAGHRNGVCCFLHAPGLSFCHATPRDRQGNLRALSNHVHLAAVHCCHRCPQHFCLEPEYPMGSFSQLHLQILPLHRKRWFCFSWRNTFMRHRWIFSVTKLLGFSVSCSSGGMWWRHSLWFSGSEVMFAYRGRFTAASIRVYSVWVWRHDGQFSFFRHL